MRRTFFVGMVHGPGRQRGVMLLVLARSPRRGRPCFILIFGLGSVGGMLLLSRLISLPFILTAQRFSAVTRWIRLVAGIHQCRVWTLPVGNRLGATMVLGRFSES